MLRVIMNLFHRPTIRSGMTRDPRGQFRNPRFLSFIAQSNRTTLDTHFQEAVLRSRKLLRQAFVVLLVGGCAWVVVESAKAFSMF